MLTQLLYLQFGLMYLPALVIGLVVYGSDFDSPAGWIYITPLVVMLAVHKALWSRRFSIGSAITVRLVSGLGAAAGLLAYNSLHMDYWDEHSIRQALAVALLGLCSYVVSVIAAAALSRQPMNQPRNQPTHAAAALAIIGAGWLLALLYPMIIVFLLAVLFIIATLTLQPSRAAQAVEAKSGVDLTANYAVFLLTVDLSSVIWDFQVNSGWALYIGLGLIAAALGYVFRLAWRAEKLVPLVYSVALANFAVAAIWPPYVLWIWHAVIAGFCLGYALSQAISARDASIAEYSLSWTPGVFLGLALSNAWYANLQWAATRLVLITPFVVLAAMYLTQRIRRAKHHS